MKLWQFHKEELVKLKKELPGLTTCPNCGAAIKPHRACPECGNYKGKEVVKTDKTEE